MTVAAGVGPASTTTAAVFVATWAPAADTDVPWTPDIPWTRAADTDVDISSPYEAYDDGNEGNEGNAGNEEECNDGHHTKRRRFSPETPSYAMGEDSSSEDTPEEDGDNDKTLSYEKALATGLKTSPEEDDDDGGNDDGGNDDVPDAAHGTAYDAGLDEALRPLRNLLERLGDDDDGDDDDDDNEVSDASRITVSLSLRPKRPRKTRLINN